MSRTLAALLGILAGIAITVGAGWATGYLDTTNPGTTTREAPMPVVHTQPGQPMPVPNGPAASVKAA